jgi:hypothetical protein
MIDEDEIARIIQLFAHLGSALAIDMLFTDAKEAVDKGRRDLTAHLLDLSAQFFRLRAEMGDDVNEDADGLRVIGISLRLVAHKLYKECGNVADDPRLLKLVNSRGEKS